MKTIRNIKMNAVAVFFALLLVSLTVSCSREDRPEGFGSSKALSFEVGVNNALDESKGLNPVGLSAVSSEFIANRGGDSIFLNSLENEFTGSVFENGASTKVKPYSNTNKIDQTTGSFGLVAYTYGASGADISGWTRYCLPIEVKYKSSASRWEPVSETYWPYKGNYIRFFAYAPYRDGDGSAFSVTSSNTTMPKIAVTVNADISKQTDFLVAESVESYDKLSSADRNNVNLVFSHAMTGIRFKAKKTLNVSSVAISGVYDKADLQTGMTSSDMVWSGHAKLSQTYTLTSPKGTENGDYIDFSDSLTIMMIPQEIPDGAKIVITFSDASKIECNLAGHTWERGKMITYIISNSGMDGSLSYYLENLSDEKRFITIETDDQPHTATLEVESYWSGSSGAKTPTDLTLLYAAEAYGPFYRIEDVPAGSSILDMVDASDPVTITNTGTKYSVNINVKANTLVGITPQRTTRTADLRSRFTVTDVDLSLWEAIERPTAADYGASRSIPKTANTYVIRQKGTYKFPCVYGNAIDGILGQVSNYSIYDNEAAYSPEADVASSTYLTPFLNFNSSGITNPFLHLDDDITTASKTALERADEFIENYEAVIVWQDVVLADGFIEGLSLSKSFLQGTSDLTSPVVMGNIPYVNFTINDKIQEGNVVIAVRRKSDQTIVWSWQIWVSAERSLYPVELQDYAYMNGLSGGTVSHVIPVPLGWNSEEDYTYYPDRVLYVKLVQNGSSKTTSVIKIEQQYEVFDGQIGGSAPYYQWGRKDPLVSVMVTYSTDSITVDGVDYLKCDVLKTVSSPAGYNVINGYNTMYVISGVSDGARKSIQNPHNYLDGYSEGKYVNTWDADATQLNVDRKPVKTIYDPCPPGFSVPRRNFATGMSLGDKPDKFAAENRMNLASGAGEEGYYYKAKKAVGVYVKRNANDRDGLLLYAQSFYGTFPGGSNCLVGNDGHIGHYWTACQYTNSQSVKLRFNIAPTGEGVLPFVEAAIPLNRVFGGNILAAKED